MGRPILQSEAVDGTLQSTSATRAHAKRMRAEHNWCCEHASRADNCYGCAPAPKLQARASPANPLQATRAPLHHPASAAGEQHRSSHRIHAEVTQRNRERDRLRELDRDRRRDRERVTEHAEIWARMRTTGNALASRVAQESASHRSRVHLAEERRIAQLLDAHLDGIRSTRTEPSSNSAAQPGSASGSGTGSRTVREILIDGPSTSRPGYVHDSRAAYDLFGSGTPPSDEVSILRTSGPPHTSEDEPALRTSNARRAAARLREHASSSTGSAGGSSVAQLQTASSRARARAASDEHFWPSGANQDQYLPPPDGPANDSRAAPLFQLTRRTDGSHAVERTAASSVDPSWGSIRFDVADFLQARLPSTVDLSAPAAEASQTAPVENTDMIVDGPAAPGPSSTDGSSAAALYAAASRMHTAPQQHQQQQQRLQQPDERRYRYRLARGGSGGGGGTSSASVSYSSHHAVPATEEDLPITLPYIVGDTGGPDERSSSIGTTAPAAHRTTGGSAGARSVSPPDAGWYGRHTLPPLLGSTSAAETGRSGARASSRSHRPSASASASTSHLPAPSAAAGPAAASGSRSRSRNRNRGAALEQWERSMEVAGGHEASAFESIMDGLDALSAAERREVLRVLADRVRRNVAQDVEVEGLEGEEEAANMAAAAAAATPLVGSAEAASDRASAGRARHFTDRAAAIRALMGRRQLDLPLTAASSSSSDILRTAGARSGASNGGGSIVPSASAMAAADDLRSLSPVPCPIIFPGGVDPHVAMQLDHDGAGASGSGSGSGSGPASGSRSAASSSTGHTPPSLSSGGAAALDDAVFSTGSSSGGAASSSTSAAPTPLHIGSASTGGTGAGGSGAAGRGVRRVHILGAEDGEDEGRAAAAGAIPSIEEHLRDLLDSPEPLTAVDAATAAAAAGRQGAMDASGEESDEGFAATSSALVERMHRVLMARPDQTPLPPAPAPFMRE